MDDEKLERELDQLTERLPEVLRGEWVVIPRATITQISVVCLLVGAALALLIAGFLEGVDWMTWSWPVVIGGLMLVTRFVPWWRGDRQIEQLRQARTEGHAPR